jgi:hypothetical protein
MKYEKQDECLIISLQHMVNTFNHYYWCRRNIKTCSTDKRAYVNSSWVIHEGIINEWQRIINTSIRPLTEKTQFLIIEKEHKRFFELFGEQDD